MLDNVDLLLTIMYAMTQSGYYVNGSTLNVDVYDLEVGGVLYVANTDYSKIVFTGGTVEYKDGETERIVSNIHYGYASSISPYYYLFLEVPEYALLSKAYNDYNSVKVTAKDGNTITIVENKGDIPSKTWSTDIPSGTVAGNYIVYFKAQGTGNYTESAETAVKVTISKSAPAVNSWPTVNTSLGYTGEEKDLIIEPKTVPTSGTFKYSVKTKSEIEEALIAYSTTYSIDTATSEQISTAMNEAVSSVDNWENAFNTTISQGRNAGTYYVAYYVDAIDTNYIDSAITIIPVTINKAAVTYTAPVLQSTRLTYRGTALELIKTAGSVTDQTQGTMYYAVTETQKAPDAGANIWTTDAATIKADKTGTFYVWYMIKGDNPNYGLDATKLGTVKVTQYVAPPPSPTYYSQTWTLTMGS